MQPRIIYIELQANEYMESYILLYIFKLVLYHDSYSILILLCISNSTLIKNNYKSNHS